jgi:hypothetical protein
MVYNRCTKWTLDCHLFVCRAPSSWQTIRLLCSTIVDNQSVHPTSIPFHLPVPMYQPSQILHPATPFISPSPLSTWPKPPLPPQCCRSGSLNQSRCVSFFVNCRENTVWRFGFETLVTCKLRLPLLFHLLPFLLGQNLHCPLNAAGQGLSQSIKVRFIFCELQGKILSEDLVLRHWLLADCVWRRSSRGDWDLSSDVLGISLFRSETSSLSPALSIGEPCFRLQCRR